MARRAAWEFDDGDAFDGASLYAEVVPEPAQSPRDGTLELTATPMALHRATLLARGVPGRDPGAFAVVLTPSGAISISCTDRAGAPIRVRTPDGFAGVGEMVQVTLPIGAGGTVTVVNCDRRGPMADNPAAGFVAQLPSRARCDLRGPQGLTFGAASGGIAPFFKGKIHRVTVSDSRDAPTVPVPEARLLHVDFRTRGAVRPRRVLPRKGAPRTLDAPGRRAGVSSMRVATAEGDLAVGRLVPGTEVLTRTSGLMPVIWAGRADFDWMALRGRAGLRPVVLRRDALGPGLPEADLVLAPGHRVLPPCGGLRVSTDPDGLVRAETLATAVQLPEIDAIGAAYAHFFMDRTEMVQVNGLWCEALNPYDATLSPAQQAWRRELTSMFRDLGAPRDQLQV